MSKENGTGQNSPTPKEIAEIQQAICTEKCKDSVVEWLKKRFSLMLIVVTVAGFFGISELLNSAADRYVENKSDWVDESVKLLREKTTEAEILAEKTKAVLLEAEKQTEEYAKSISGIQLELEKAQKSLELLQQNAKLTTEKYLALDADARNIRADVNKDINSLDARVKRLDELVAVMAVTPQASPKALEAYKETVAIAKDNTKKIEEQFADNARYRVSIFYSRKMESISHATLEGLTKVGFKATALTGGEARDIHSVTQMSIPTKQAKEAPDIDSLKVNIVTYTPDVKFKAEEIRKILSSVPGVGKTELIPKQDFTERFGESFLGQTSPERPLTNNVIEIYLAQGERNGGLGF